ncbi:unnamed protein product [Schistosoma mattheei]|uniref:Protein FAM91A1 n=1 Tax=Schistosoma mattheei TaxID=31246 RepID=A0AA85BKD4_9TREM|nr:unnamed protein product [Schistosoma mattheei]
MLSDIQASTDSERITIDQLIDAEKADDLEESNEVGPGILVKNLDQNIIKGLYLRGLVYIDIPVSSDDKICVPTLEGFVMNRISGDIRENLLYKIFVTADENTSVSELAECLQVDVNSVKQAASIFCRLGFAQKRIGRQESRTQPFQTPISIEESDTLLHTENSVVDANLDSFPSVDDHPQQKKKLVLIFDSTITAYLMMGNLSPNLKPHAVTMFEVGKLSDDSLNSFIFELNHLAPVSEGEAGVYREYALNLRKTIHFLRSQASLDSTDFCDVDLIRGGSLLSLEAETRIRVLRKNYNVVQYNSKKTESSVNVLPTLLITCGTRISRLPLPLRGISRFWLTAWGHDAVVIDSTNFLTTANDMLLSSPVLIQAIESYEFEENLSQRYIPLPISKEFLQHSSNCVPEFIIHLMNVIDLTYVSGYIIVLAPMNKKAVLVENELLTIMKEHKPIYFITLRLGLPIFNMELNHAVCAQISNQNLLSTNNRNHLKATNHLLVEEFTKFIFNDCSGLLPNQNQCSYSTLVTSSGGNFPDTWPLPTKNMMCANGILSFF